LPVVSFDFSMPEDPRDAFSTGLLAVALAGPATAFRADLAAAFSVSARDRADRIHICSDGNTTTRAVARAAATIAGLLYQERGVGFAPFPAITQPRLHMAEPIDQEVDDNPRPVRKVATRGVDDESLTAPSHIVWQQTI
jgi:hypothetical protein